MSYADYEEKTTSDDALARLSRLAEDLATADATVAKAEAALQEAKEKQRQLSETDIPMLMDEMGISEFTTSTGFKISVKENIRAHILVANRPTAFAWLEEHGHAHIIKREISVEFDKDQEEQASQLFAELRERAGRMRVSQDASVNAQTLAAWTREQLSEGVDIPIDLFGVLRQRIAKIK